LLGRCLRRRSPHLLAQHPQVEWLLGRQPAASTPCRRWRGYLDLLPVLGKAAGKVRRLAAPARNHSQRGVPAATASLH
jgi:hypothetical protein